MHNFARVLSRLEKATIVYHLLTLITVQALRLIIICRLEKTRALVFCSSLVFFVGSSDLLWLYSASGNAVLRNYPEVLCAGKYDCIVSLAWSRFDRLLFTDCADSFPQLASEFNSIEPAGRYRRL